LCNLIRNRIDWILVNNGSAEENAFANKRLSTHSNAVEMGLILLIKTPGTIRFTTRKKVMLERIYKHTEEGKSPEVPKAHEGEHRRKCIRVRTKQQRHNGVAT
jgi:hypothetical protein